MSKYYSYIVSMQKWEPFERCLTMSYKLKKGKLSMRLSTKTRYGLASLVCMAVSRAYDESITVLSLSEKLGISKIYLEQVFSLLRRGGIVVSIKGARGGYRLSRPPRDITVFDILSATETAFFEQTEKTADAYSEHIERAMRETVFDALDNSMKNTLTKITLEDVANNTETYQNGDNYMYYL